MSARPAAPRFPLEVVEACLKSSFKLLWAARHAGAGDLAAGLGLRHHVRRYALWRSLALYSEYLYYYYDLRGLASLAPGLPPRFNQRAVRAGFTLFVSPLGR